MRFRYKWRYLYLWLAISRLTRQVIGFYIGDRSVQSLQRLWFSLPVAYRRKLVYSDFYEAYATMKLMPHGSRPGNIGPVTKAVAKPASWKA